MKRFWAGLLFAAAAVSVLLVSCGGKEPSDEPSDELFTEPLEAPEGAWEFPTDLEEDETGLRARYPQYFDLGTSKGLEVYVWSMEEGGYSCGVLSGTNREKTLGEIMELSMHSLSVEAMKKVLATYDIADEDVFLVACRQPISSYYYPLDAEYCAAVSAQFDDRYVCSASAEFGE